MKGLIPILFTIATTRFPSTSSSSIGPRNDSNPTEITHSAFVLPTTYGNIAFATTAVRDVGDLYIHVEAPAVNSWFAFGTGLGMKGSLMWVFYRDEREKGIVLSTRTAAGNLEPRHTDQIPCELNIRNGITNGLIKPSDGPEIYVANVYCKNINKYLLSSIPVLDFSNTAQPFIFALGPTDKTVHTNKKDALIRRHTLTGQFTLSLPPATVNTTTAVSQTQLARISVWSNHHSSLSSSGPRTDNGAWKGSFHAALMCGTYIIVFPAGVLLLRVFESVLAHAWTQAFGVFLLFCGTGIALHLSLAYNHAKRLDSLHQILGLSVVSLTLIQLALGILHHWLFAKHGRPTILGHIHLYLGPLVLLLGAANGFLGFRFAGGSSHNLMYGIFVAVVFIGLALVLWWVRGKKIKRQNRKSKVVGTGGFEPFRRDDVATRHEGSPQRPAREEDVELRDLKDEPLPVYEEGDYVRPRSLV